MDFEDFLTNIYTPLKSIELLTETVYLKYNEDWDFIANEESKKHVQELLSLNFSIQQVTQYLLKLRKECINEMNYRYQNKT